MRGGRGWGRGGGGTKTLYILSGSGIFYVSTMADTNTHRGRELGVLSEQKVPRQTLGNVIYNDVGRFFFFISWCLA